MNVFRRSPSRESEAAVLERASAWKSNLVLPELTCRTLCDITQRNGVDFATALLFDRLKKSRTHGTFITQIETLRRSFPLPPVKLNAKIVIIPGALYRERPDMGGDGRVVREIAASFGCPTDLIPLGSFSPVMENARRIHDWLRDRSENRTILVSLSKGGADLKMALQSPEAAGLFRNVIAWINVGGPLNGSRMANWILESRVRTWLFRLKCHCQKRDFNFFTSLLHGETGALNSPLFPPPEMKLVNLIGFPLKRHLTTGLSKFCHRTLARWGPNDGTTSLSDLHKWPGLIYPVWSADHYFHPENLARTLISALLHYLADDNKRSRSSNVDSLHPPNGPAVFGESEVGEKCRGEVRKARLN